MSASTRCQKPLPVGAWGSYVETTKLLVAFGKPGRDSCGETSCPAGTPSSFESCAGGSGDPLCTVALVSSKPGTFGRYS